MKNAIRLLALLIGLVCTTTTFVQAQNRIILTPYVGYNNAAGYSVDLDDYYDNEFFLDEDDGEFDDLIRNVSVRGGILLGLAAEFPLNYEGSLDLKIRPSIETVLVSGDSYRDRFEDFGETIVHEVETEQSYLQLSGDLIAEFRQAGSSLVPFAGAGLTYVRYTAEGTERIAFEGDSEQNTEDVEGTALGLNLLGGVRFEDALGFGVPFVQLRVSIADPSTNTLSDFNVDDLGAAISLMGGVSFGL